MATFVRLILLSFAVLMVMNEMGNYSCSGEPILSYLKAG